MNRSEARLFTAALGAWITTLCVALLVTSAHTARAGINVWTSHGPPGAASALAIDPITPGTLYVGTDRGVFKSTNGGGSWSAANMGLPSGSAAAVLVIDPTTPSRLYTATTCDPASCSGRNGLFMSTDAAATWDLTGFPDIFVDALAIDPLTPGTLYAGGNGGVFKSTDGGATWGAPTGPTCAPQCFHVLVSTLVIDPITPSALYALSACNGPFCGGHSAPIKSTDAGATWIAANSGLDNNGNIYVLAINPTTPSTLYAGTQNDVGPALFKSTDGGTSWDATGLTHTAVYALAIDPRTPGTLYADTVPEGGVLKSTDGGGIWEPLNDGLPSDSPPSGFFFMNAIAIDPKTPTTLYGATNQGVFSIQQVAAKVVGTGTAASCTDAALDAALDGGGLVTFDCGPAPVTIDISAGTGTKTIRVDTAIDGGGVITISGGGLRQPGPQVLVVSEGALLSLYAVIISGASDGEGAITNNGTAIVTNSTLSGNNRAITNNGTLALANSTFSGNRHAAYGGAIVNNTGGKLTVSNCTFSGNSAYSVFNSPSDGGAILNYSGGTATVTSCSFSDNSALTGSDISNAGTLTIANTVLAGNVHAPGRPNCVGTTIVDGGHNLDDGTTCGFSTTNGSLSNTNPQLNPAGLHDNRGPTQTVALCTAVDIPAGCTAASPAINAGDQAICAAAPVNNLDQRGFLRPGDGHTMCSIGAYEADGTAACGGDCDASGSVTVDELVTLVNIALGAAPPSACPHGVPSGAEVDVALIIQAVNHALGGCVP